MLNIELQMDILEFHGNSIPHISMSKGWIMLGYIYFAKKTIVTLLDTLLH